MKSFRAVSLALMLLSGARSDPLIQIPPHIQTMELSTPKPVTEAQMQEFKQDFVDVDFNKDDQMDAQEVRAHFKGGISDVELFQFFLDSDTVIVGISGLNVVTPWHSEVLPESTATASGG